MIEEHIKKLKNKLNINPIVLLGSDAEEFIRANGSWLTQHGGFDSLTNTVAIIDRNRVGTLAHEMRHAWQFKNKDIYKFDFNKKTSNILLYLASRKEWDANKYARNYCKTNGDSKGVINYNISLASSAFFVLFTWLFDKHKNLWHQ